MPVVFIEVPNAKKPEETEAEFNNRREAVAARIEKLREAGWELWAENIVTPNTEFYMLTQEAEWT